MQIYFFPFNFVALFLFKSSSYSRSFKQKKDCLLADSLFFSDAYLSLIDEKFFSRKMNSTINF